MVDVQIKRLALEQRWGAVISRDCALLRAFAFARLLRETFRTWPARVGPLIAAEYNVDATALTLTLETYLCEQLAAPASGPNSNADGRDAGRA